MAKIFTAKIMKTLLANAAKTNAGNEYDGKPVVKVFNPYGSGTWMFTEYDEDRQAFFGLCDLGFGTPELGYVAKSDMLMLVKTPFGSFPLERDQYWTADGTLSQYAEKANLEGRICDYVN